MNLYIGIDLGKKSHIAAFLSAELLEKHRRFSACPTLSVPNDRAGFDKLLQVVKKYSTTSETKVLLEHTGHYGAAIVQYLREHDITIYQMHVRKPHRWDKTDVKDAQALSVLVYNTIEMGVPTTRETRISVLEPLPDTVRVLRGLVRHRYELTREATRRKNKLTAICDELFPEFTQTYKDPNKDSALNLREKFPTPQLVASAELDALLKTRKRGLPAPAAMKQMQKTAKTSIGTKDSNRQTSLIFEQAQLIDELRLINKHVDQLEAKIEAIITESREGKILLSFPGVGPVQAATLLAGIGSIANFESEAKLRAYMGWAPRRIQTGTTIDATVMRRDGNHVLKDTIFMMVMSAIQHDEWKDLYTRLVDRKCPYDERTKKYKGKMKVIGRIAGQMIGLIYILLQRDYELLLNYPDPKEAPAPELYDSSKHTVRGPALKVE